MAVFGNKKKKEISAAEKMNSAQDRLNRMKEENHNVINILRSQRPDEFSMEKTRQEMLNLCIGIESMLENMPFVSDDMSEIDAELITLFQCLRDMVRDGFYDTADWALRGISKGLVEFRQDVSVVQQHSASGDGAEKKKRILASRRDKLKDYVGIVQHYESCSRLERQLLIDRENYQQKSDEFNEVYEDYMLFIDTPEGMRGKKLLENDPLAHLKDPDAKTVYDRMTDVGHSMSFCKFLKASLASKQEVYDSMVDMSGQLRANLMQDPMLKDILAEERALFRRTGEKFIENQTLLWEELDEAIGDVDSMEKIIDALLHSSTVMKVLQARMKKTERIIAEKKKEKEIKEQAEKAFREEKERAEKERLEKERAEKERAEKEKMRKRLSVTE